MDMYPLTKGDNDCLPTVLSKRLKENLSLKFEVLEKNFAVYKIKQYTNFDDVDYVAINGINKGDMDAN